MTAWRSAFLAELGDRGNGLFPFSRSEKPEKPEKRVEKGAQEPFSTFSGFSEGRERKNQLLPSPPIISLNRSPAQPTPGRR